MQQKLEQKVVILQGLPASGKSSWAKDFVKSNPGWKRVNKDDLRGMLDAGTWSGTNEKFIKHIRNTIIGESLHAGLSIIVDDTNLDESNIQSITSIVDVYNLKLGFGNNPMLAKGETRSAITRPPVVIEVKEFKTEVKECLIRDENRENPVGKKVILGMYKKYMAHDFVPRVQDSKLPHCIICDIDNTTSIKNPNRGPFEFEKAYEDEVNWTVVFALEAMVIHAGLCELIFLSGREEKYRELTWKFIIDKAGLLKYNPLLIMRATNDCRPDTEVKRELYEQHIKGKFNVKLCLDDRVGVVRMWRELGISCFEVREGLF